jgi:hypothetical protein
MVPRFKRTFRLVVIASVAFLAGCSSASTGPNTLAAARHLYPLPSSGWKPGDASFLVGSTGVLHAALSKSGACAWLQNPGSNQPRRLAFLWPAGYRVRFDPTELIDARGRVVARAGERISVGGGVYSTPPQSWCTAHGMAAFLVQSGITVG